MATCARALAVLLLVAPLAAQAQPTRTPPPELARAHADAARRHFEAKEYDQAARELKAAIRFEPKPAYVYALGQAQRLGGDCAGAIRSYQQFLATSPPARQAEAARENIARCEAEPSAQPTTQPAAAPAATRPDEDDPRPRRRWYTDPLGGALSGTGLAVAITGSVLLAVGRGGASRANSASAYDDYLASADGAAALQRAGVVLLSVGGALLVGGVLRYVLRPSRRIERPSITAALTPAGGAVLLLGRF